MFYAAELVSPGLATVLTNTQPLIASLLGWYFLKEHLNKLSIFAILLAFTGIGIISATSFTAESSHISTGVSFISIAALGIALSNILLKKLTLKVDILYAMGFQLIIGAIPLSLLSFTHDEFNLLQWDLRYSIILFAMAIFGTALPFILWFWLMDKAPLYKLNVFSFLTPVFGLSMGTLYFSESLYLSQWFGVALIGFSIFIATKQKD